MVEINYWYIIVPVATVAFIYVVRRIRVWQWGSIRDKYLLTGKTFIITGANTGLGFEATKALVIRDATVIMACRNLDKAEQAIAAIRKVTLNGSLIPCHLNLASFESIVDFVNNIKANHPTFDCLINNAGLAIPKWDLKTEDGIELHFGTMHVGHFLLTRLLSDRIEANTARIVIVSSVLHTKGVIDFDTIGKCIDRPGLIRRGHNLLYNTAKLANFYHARELFKRGYDAHVLCPGLCHTDFFRSYDPKWYHYIIFSPIVWLVLRSAEQGAANIVYCATDNMNTITVNPKEGYYVRSLKQTKSPHPFSDEISERLWSESEKLCSTIILREEGKK